jgi:hypothetical protein
LNGGDCEVSVSILLYMDQFVNDWGVFVVGDDTVIGCDIVVEVVGRFGDNVGIGDIRGIELGNENRGVEVKGTFGTENGVGGRGNSKISTTFEYPPLLLL